MKISGKIVFWIGICLALLLAACDSNPTPISPTPGGELTLEEQQTMNAVIPDAELTYQEQLAMTPPAPGNLKINPEGNGVVIYWEAAGPVTIPHGYSDEVLYYKVFRRAEGALEAVQLGTTKELSYLDANRTAADRYYYSVVAVHKGLEGGEIDSSRSDEIFWGE